MVAEERQSRAEEETAKLRTWLAEARSQAEAIQASPELAALRTFRDCYIAHNLSQLEPDPNTPTEIRRVRFGNEAKLLDGTVQIADQLHLALNSTGFMWDDSRDIARNNAKSL